jgi:DNA polymerase-3 subunit delta
MLLKGVAAARALAQPDAAIRLYILGGPDESGSRALAADFARAMGADADRIDLSPARIREDPAILADEAAAIGLFGGRRWISVTLSSGGGDELLAAADNLLAAAAAGNPVVVVGAGITAKSRLAKLAEKHAQALLVISWLPEGDAADRLAETLATQHGLSITRDVARAIAQATGGDRGLMAREIEKLALYRDAAPDRPGRAELPDWQAIGAGLDEEDLGGAVNIVLEGRLRDLPELLAGIESMGTNAISLVRALARRALELAALRTHVEAGRPVGQVMESHGKSVFWKEKAHVTRQLGLWDAARLARLVDRLQLLEQQLKAPDNAGMLVLRAGLLDIARVSASARR